VGYATPCISKYLPIYTASEHRILYFSSYLRFLALNGVVVSIGIGTARFKLCFLFTQFFVRFLAFVV
jgi:hypothetical protein